MAWQFKIQVQKDHRISPLVMATMLRDRKPSSRLTYYCTWRAYFVWYKPLRFHPQKFSIPYILTFFSNRVLTEKLHLAPLRASTFPMTGGPCPYLCPRCSSYCTSCSCPAASVRPQSGSLPYRSPLFEAIWDIPLLELSQNKRYPS